jgi:membrane associated rhomboid family serine protease
MLIQEFKNLKYGLWVAAIWVALLWGIEFLDGMMWDVNFESYGIRPGEWAGLWGIFTSPFLHGSIRDHLLGNSLSLFPLVVVLFLFFRKVAWNVIGFVIIATGFWVWVVGNHGSNHIGVSGVIYGLASFLFFSGIFRKDALSLAVSLIVVMFHGNMVWGAIPFFTPEHVSWEAHLFGALAGLTAAFVYKNEDRKPPKKYSWDQEELQDNDGGGVWDYRKLQPPPEGFMHPE